MNTLEQQEALLCQELDVIDAIPDDTWESLEDQEEHLAQQMKKLLKAPSLGEEVLEMSRMQKVQWQEVVDHVRSQLIGLERCEKLQASAFQLRDEVKLVSVAQESLVQRRDLLLEEISQEKSLTWYAEAEAEEELCQERAGVQELQAAVLRAEEDLSKAEEAARSRRVSSCEEPPRPPSLRADGEAHSVLSWRLRKRVPPDWRPTEACVDSPADQSSILSWRLRRRVPLETERKPPTLAKAAQAEQSSVLTWRLRKR
ncbi:unnamed protein product, partial [Durusdinium trenchii]